MNSPSCCVGRSVRVLVLSLAAAAAQAQEQPPKPAVEPQTGTVVEVRSPVQALLTDTAGTLWYGAYKGDKKIGYSCSVVEVDATEVRMETHIHLTLRVAGRDIEAKMLSTIVADPEPPHAVRSKTTKKTLGDSGSTTLLVWTEDAVHETVTRGETVVETRRAPSPYSLSEALIAELWVRTGPVTGSSVPASLRAAGGGGHVGDGLEILSVRPTARDGAPITIFELRSTHADGEVLHRTLDDRGLVLGYEHGGFVFRREPESVAKDIDAPVDAYLETLVRLSTPVGDLRGVTRLVLELDAQSAVAIGDAPGQRVRHLDDGTCVVELTPASGPRVAATEQEIAQALVATSRYPCANSRIVKLAQDAIGDARSPREQVDRLVEFVSSFLADAPVLAVRTCEEVIDARRGSCSDHVLLFCTLSRAVGVPCREVVGVVYLGDRFGALGGYRWNEVVLDGDWVPVDPTLAQTRVDATHIRYGVLAADHIGTVGVLAGKTLRVVEFERAE